MVVAVVGILSAVMMPSLAGARAAAKMAACAVQVHQVGVGLASYTADARHRWPPFLFSESSRPNLPLSGHYGGEGPPDIFRSGDVGDRDVNLHALRREGMIDESHLICPGASMNLRRQQTGYFRQGRFSTYCLRMPLSRDLWPTRTPPPGWDRDALYMYRFVAGGQEAPCGGEDILVPQLRVDRQYVSDVPGGGTFDPAADAVVSDAFVDRAYGDPVSRVERNWCHEGRFNVLRGHGAVRLANSRNDATHTMPRNTSPPGTTTPVDDTYNAAPAEAIWRFFDSAIR